MKKCLFWGMTDVYSSCKNIIDFEIMKGTIEVLAMVSKDKLCSKIDGLEVIDKSEIKNYEFDYIVIFAKAHSAIKKELEEMNIPRKKVIDYRVFQIPCFDFERYTNLIENPVSIISDDCWGGKIYHYLGLKLSSPFINCYTDKTAYLNLLSNFKSIINAPLIEDREASLSENQFPIAKFKNTDIKFMLIHSNSFEEFNQKWKRRKNRINQDNLLIKMTIDNDEQAEMFDNLPFKNKIGFYFKKTKFDSIVYCPEYINRPKYQEYCCTYQFVTYVLTPQNIVRVLDIFKLLNREKKIINTI